MLGAVNRRPEKRIYQLAYSDAKNYRRIPDIHAARVGRVADTYFRGVLNMVENNSHGRDAQVLSLIKDLKSSVKGIEKSMSALEVQFAKSDGEYKSEMASVKALGKERYETHSGEIKCLWDRIEAMNPEQIRANLENVEKKLVSIEREIQNNRDTNLRQDDRLLQFTSGALKHIAVILGTAILTWFVTKKL